MLQLTDLQTTFVVCPKCYSWQIFKLPLMCVPNITADKSSNYPCVCPKYYTWQIFKLSLLCVPNTTDDKSSNHTCCVSQILQMTKSSDYPCCVPNTTDDKSSDYPHCHKNITTDKCLDYFYIITLSGVTYSKIYYSVHLLHILTKETVRWAKELWVTVPLKRFDEIKCILSRSVQHSRMVCNNATEHAIL